MNRSSGACRNSFSVNDLRTTRPRGCILTAGDAKAALMFSNASPAAKCRVRRHRLSVLPAGKDFAARCDCDQTTPERVSRADGQTKFNRTTKTLTQWSYFRSLPLRRSAAAGGIDSRSFLPGRTSQLAATATKRRPNAYPALTAKRSSTAQRRH